jgi:hypothetical protein
LFGGDGMQVEVDPRDNNTVYVGYQYGNYYRIDQAADTSTSITPKHELGQRPYRWNWQSPILISPHNPDVFYLGSNVLHRSVNRGDDFKAISKDLTAGGRKGDVAFGTLTTISESPKQPNLLYVGSDDGRIHRSKNGGVDWDRLDDGLPQNLWVSRIAAGKHDANVVYATLNGYRSDHFGSHVYKSIDMGDTWVKIGNYLPNEAVNVILEDPSNPQLLFVGTDHGLYVSMDGGKKFAGMSNGLPAVAVHDLVIQKKAKDLIVGTHGRSLYLANIGILQTAAVEQPGITFTGPSKLRYSSRYGARDFNFKVREPETEFQVFLPGGSAGAKLMIKSSDGITLFVQDVKLNGGVTTLPYDMSFDGHLAGTLENKANAGRSVDKRPVSIKPAKNGKYYLRPGKYTAVLGVNGTEAQAEFVVK